MNNKKRPVDFDLLGTELKRKGYDASIDRDDDGVITRFEAWSEYLSVSTVLDQVVIRALDDWTEHCKPAMFKTESLDTGRVLAFAKIYTELLQSVQSEQSEAA